MTNWDKTNKQEKSEVKHSSQHAARVHRFIEWIYLYKADQIDLYDIVFLYCRISSKYFDVTFKMK